MEQLVILLLVGVVALVKWVYKKSAEAIEKQQQEQGREQSLEQGLGPEESPEKNDYPFQPEASREQDPQQSMRRLMDALGLPQDSPPPLPVTPPPIVRREPMVEPSWSKGGAGLIAAAEAIPSAETLAQRFRQASVPATVQTVAPSRVRQMLSQPGTLRDAVILTEILGPPKAYPR